MSAYADALLEDLGKKAPQGDPCGIEVTSTAAGSPDEAWGALRGEVVRGAKGWCVTTDRVWRVETVAGVDEAKAGGVLLDAEVAQGSLSVHIRHLGGAWQVTTLAETERGPKHWVQQIERRGIDPDDPRAANTLIYRAYWRIDVPITAQPCAQIQPAAVRFIALKPTPQEES